MIKYYLALEHQYRDFFPVNNAIGNYPPFYIYNIQVIDNFTKRYTNEEELKRYLLSINVIDEEEMNSNLTIYYLDGKIRKSNDGICYKEDYYYLDPNNLKEILIVNKDNKEFLNQIICKLKDNFKEKTIAFNYFLDNLFKISENRFEVLELIKYIEYKELRTLGFYIKSKTKNIELNKNITYSYKHKTELI